MEKCLIFGTSKSYLRRKFLLNYKTLKIIGMLDNDATKWGLLVDGIPIDSPNNINKYEFDYILIMSSFHHEIYNQLLTLGILREKILNIYSLLNQNGHGRTFVANQYIRYDDDCKYGIEVGGANNPINIIDTRVIVKQVDYCDHSLLDDCYNNLQLIKVDIIDDGEKLEKFDNNSLDFIVSCHMLEHCRNPIGTLKIFLDRLKVNGIIFLAIPDKRYTFDINRKLTSIEHLLLDDKEPNRERDIQHYYDKEIGVLSKEETDEIQRLIDCDERIHFHVWDSNSFIEFIYELNRYLGNIFSIEQVGNLDNGIYSNEIICVLKKIK